MRLYPPETNGNKNDGDGSDLCPGRSCRSYSRNRRDGWGKGPCLAERSRPRPLSRRPSTAQALRTRVLCFDARGAAEWVSLSAAVPQAAFGDELLTSQGSQQPPGSPLSREEGEAPPPAPAPEGRRRSRRVRLRGSCRHRPSFLGRRELGTSAPAGTASVSEVSEIPNNGARGSEGLGEP